MLDTLKNNVGTTVAFGDVIQLSKASSKDPVADGFKRYVGLEHLEPSDLKVRSWGNIADGITFTKVFKPGQVLFGKRRAYQRKVAVAGFSGVCSGDIYVLEPKGDELLPELLPFICQSESFYDYVISMSQGGLSPRVNWKALAKYEFALPPLKEQRRITEVLHQAGGLIEKLVLLQESAVSAFSSAASIKYSALSDNYPTVRLAEICLKKPQSGIYKSDKYRGSGVPMVNMGELFGNDIIDGEIEMEKVELDETELQRYRLTSNDLLFGRRSVVLEGAGRCILVGDPGDSMVFESSVLRASIDPKKADNRFVFEWLRSPLGHQRIRRIVTFTTVSGVAGSDVACLPVPIPPLEVQKRIADEFSGLRGQIGVLSERIEESKKLLKTLLGRVLEEA